MHPQAPSPALAAQSKAPRPKVLGSHFTFQAGGVGEGARGYPPPKALPARGHDSLQPQIPRPGARWQCLILALTPNGDTTSPQLSTAAAPNAGLCPGHNPGPTMGQQRPLLLGPRHRTEPSQKQQWRGRSRHRGWWAAAGPRALQKSGQAVHAASGLVLGGRGRLRHRNLDAFLSCC